jgi:hypothetical protein
VVAAAEGAALPPRPRPPLLLHCQLQLVQRLQLGLMRRLRCKAYCTAMVVT